MEYHYKPKGQGIDQKKLAMIGVVIIGLAIFAVMNYNPKSVSPPPQTTTTTTTTEIETTGDIIIAVKDAKRKVPIVGDVNELFLTVTEVSVHKAGDNSTNETAENDTAGWVTVFSGIKTFDLLTLQDVSGILAESSLEQGKYTQIRMTVSSGSIKLYNEQIAAYNKTYELIVPSESFKFVHPFEIEVGKTTALTVDFNVEETIRKSDNKYLLAPVVKITDEKLEKGKTPANSIKLLNILESECPIISNA